MYFKKRIEFWITVLVSSVFLLSCAPTAYFKTPNDVYKMNATVNMADGTIKNGLLTVLFENNIDTKSSLISLASPDGKTEQKINVSDIKSYMIEGNTYVRKYVNLYTAGINYILFVKQLSPENSKIKLYQLEQKYKSNNTGEDRDFYFISVPSQTTMQLIELHSSVLVPSFDEKMSAFIADCPSLLTKIKDKQKGYFYNFLTATFKKVEIMKRIIQEYNNCSQH